MPGTTTSKGIKKVAGGAHESKNEMLKKPGNLSNRRKAVETSTCHFVSSQLDECKEETDEEEVVDQKVEHALMYNGRKVDVVKKESALQKSASTVQKPYSMRRSTRMTEKKSAETMVKKDSVKAVKIDSFMDDEVNVGLHETNVKPVVENFYDAFENLHVLVVEKSNCSPVLAEAVDIAINETSNPCEELAKAGTKPQAGVISFWVVQLRVSAGS